MTDLICNAESCVHNCDKFCCKGTILVEGSSAKCCGDTSCASFDEQTQSCCKNQYETPSRGLSVECEATTCIHNAGRVCTAEEIVISGSHAKNACQTECGTYQAR